MKAGKNSDRMPLEDARGREWRIPKILLQSAVIIKKRAVRRIWRRVPTVEDYCLQSLIVFGCLRYACD